MRYRWLLSGSRFVSSDILIDIFLIITNMFVFSYVNFFDPSCLVFFLTKRFLLQLYIFYRLWLFEVQFLLGN